MSGSIFCLAYARGRADEREEPWFFYEDRRGDGREYERTAVVTTETLPDFSAGAAAWTPDEGQTWFTLPQVSGYWAVAFANPRAGWFVGNKGQILKISF